MMDKRAFGRSLRQRRESAGLTKEAVAVGVDRSWQTVTLWENGSVVPPLPVLHRLAAVLRCDPVELVEASSSALASS